VTPRLGALPEINALWFQAHCLHWIWTKSKSTDADEIKRLGKLVLGCKEVDRPNMIFLHSIPLAPSFVLNDSRSLGTDLKIALDKLWTPVGLRTLSPNHPGYRPRCEGDQTTRDQAYHQGPPWGWLGGHFEMARNRFMGALAGENPEDIKKTSQAEWNNPIAGHLPELFDAEFPFTPRGTPAQAWSLACAEEATARRKGRVDAKLTQLLAQRWMERLDRQSEAEGERRP
jgi:hypothetical protein